MPVAAAWNVSETKVLAETPQAIDLLRHCAFFGPEPIPIKLFDQGLHALGPPLREILSDQLLRVRAIGALRRYGLVRIDNRENTLQVHRILQRLIRDRLNAEERGLIRRDVHLLLAAYDPARPDDHSEWPRYAELLAHAGPSRAVQRAHLMKRHLGTVLWALGDHHTAYDLNRRTLRRMREVFGAEHEETLCLTTPTQPTCASAAISPSAKLNHPAPVNDVRSSW